LEGLNQEIQTLIESLIHNHRILE